jgi:Helix-turn-helix of DDE superfamily endonuclease/DDE superfamily endonuclease
MLFYRAAMPLSPKTLAFVSEIIGRHRISIGSSWRKLNSGQQALLVLVYLRKGETFAEVAAGFGVSTATAWRYVNETVALLAARAPKLRKAVRDAKKAGCAWVSGALPGSVHDKKAEWIWGVLAELEAVGLITLADKGYQGSTYAKIPYKGKNKPQSQKQANKAHAKLRSPGERANAQLKTWRILRKLRCCPLARRTARQGHPRSAGPRGKRRMKKVQWARTRRLSTASGRLRATSVTGAPGCVPAPGPCAALPPGPSQAPGVNVLQMELRIIIIIANIPETEEHGSCGAVTQSWRRPCPWA